ncbi:exosome complex component rrp42-like protein, partial [Trifolium pratense]
MCQCFIAWHLQGCPNDLTPTGCLLVSVEYLGHVSLLRSLTLASVSHWLDPRLMSTCKCRQCPFRVSVLHSVALVKANGSARVRIGATEVIVSVKAELGKPSLMQPDKGNVSIYIDCSSTAEPAFEGRGADWLSADLSNALQRCLLGAKSGAGAGIDRSSLVVVEGKICWDLYIDGLVISSDGNLLDALGAAIK